MVGAEFGPRRASRGEGVIAEFLPCAQCGHNLQGALPTETCSVCGRPVSDSLRGDFLIYCGAGVVRRLLDAVQVVLISALVLGSLLTLA